MGRHAKENQVRRNYRMDGLIFRRLRALMNLYDVHNETGMIEYLINEKWIEEIGRKDPTRLW